MSTQNWDSVPWSVGGGAKHSTNIARLLAHVAFGGKEGIVKPADCRVTELAIPGTQVQVAPGAVGIRNRAAGAFSEGYAGRLPVADLLDIPDGGANGQSYMVVARVENPHIGGEPWTLPTDPEVGPYIFTRAIACSDTAETIGDLPASYQSQSLIPLARVEMPANTGTVQQSYITDLRTLVAPRQELIQRIITLGGAKTPEPLTTAEFTRWPQEATWTERIPSWATLAQVVAIVSGAKLMDVGPAGGNWQGKIQLVLGSKNTGDTDVNLDVIGGGGATQSAGAVMCAGDLQIPSADRGANVNLSLQGLRTGASNASFQAAPGTSVWIQVTYYEAPEQQGWAQ